MKISIYVKTGAEVVRTSALDSLGDLMANMITSAGRMGRSSGFCGTAVLLQMRKRYNLGLTRASQGFTQATRWPKWTRRRRLDAQQLEEVDRGIQPGKASFKALDAWHLGALDFSAHAQGV